MNTKPSWFLAPRASHPDGPIKLGSILISPTRPEEPLYDSAHLLPKADNLTVWAEKDFTFDNSKEKGGSVGIWASFLELILGIGGDVTVGGAKGGGYKLTAERMVSKQFVPSMTYLQDCIQQDEVRNYIAESRFRSKVYVIVGVMIACEAGSYIKDMKEHNMTLKLGVDGTALGAPISAGPKVETNSKRELAIGSKGSDDFVFAYRVREIKIKNSGKIVQRVIRRGALFEGDQSPEDYEEYLKSEEQQAVAEVVGLSEEDVIGEDFDYEVKKTVDEATGEEVFCYAPEE
ncbi:hypothetical protein HBH64_055430 [Parastagonospora nodorum]|nr:hypothetical protein HBI01_087650 [Parastagonospora nodorum]KAH4312296.1 hypothetical protein HBI02_091550 [Parastagonospora nodorum]KAH4331531.1 hypothetical protein HBI00_076770 [Parastagonospora nodorum]KAH4371402.1 hypothetical protein HBH94_113420 [Parastagonospora nodorum]KAH4467436.1 hypothetical protein HBH90_095410 [Parastagonospora nodorum]